MKEKNVDLLNEIAGYYSAKFMQHGETARGVDWNGEDSQVLRFHQLCKIIDKSDHFSLNDLGCGYGALYDFLFNKYHKEFNYFGVDVSKEMLNAAGRRHLQNPQANFILSSKPDRMSDYGIASGIFNVRMGRSDGQWQSYLESTLNDLDKTSKLGFAFNCLTSYSDRDKMREHLYYADPCFLFDLCKRKYSRHVSLLNDYGLYEFTILVRKQI
jgi:SAM-dependent methyltransferase